MAVICEPGVSVIFLVGCRSQVEVTPIAQSMPPTELAVMGMAAGDGPAGPALGPAPAIVAQPSLRMGGDYLYWRASEGGAGISTSMPGWKFRD